MPLDGPRWFALWTNSHCEQLVHDNLTTRGFRAFLPTIRVWSRRAGVCRPIQQPMFPGYLFVHETMDKRNYIEIVKTRGLVRILGERWDNLEAIDDGEIESIRRFASAALPATPYPYLREGQRVRITDGPLSGVEGYFVRSKPNRGLFVISIALLQRSVAVEIEWGAVEPAGAPLSSSSPALATASVARAVLPAVTRGLPLARTLALFAILAVVPSMESEAQETWRTQPVIGVTEVFESDVFSTPAHRRADIITRFTPGAVTTYESPTMTFSGRYTLDVERFGRYSEMSSLDAGQQGTVSMAYQAAPRVSVTAGADLLRTRTPRDFNIATGLTAARARAKRYAAHASVSRQFSAVTSGTLGYTFTGDRLARSFASDTHGADATFTRRLSSRTEVRGAYRVQAHEFASAGARSHVTSHAVSLGAGRAMTTRLRASLDIGPRLTGDVVRPELGASLACDCAPVDLTLAYTHTQTTVVGLAGAADVQSVGLTIGHTFGRSLEVQVAPAFFQSRLAERQADVYALAVSVGRPISAHAALDITLQGSVQRGNVYPGAGDVVPRHTILMRLVAGPGIGKAQR